MLSQLFCFISAACYLAGWVFLIKVRPLWLFSGKVQQPSLNAVKVYEATIGDVQLLIDILDRITRMYWVLYTACFFGVWLNIGGLCGILPFPLDGGVVSFVWGMVYFGGIPGISLGLFFTHQDVVYCQVILTALEMLKPEYSRVKNAK